MPEKLVRDLIPEIIRQEGRELRYRQVKYHGIHPLLMAKLWEEVRELSEIPEDEHSRALEELADVVEVVHALARYHQYSPEELEQFRIDKAYRKGAFALGLVLQLPSPPTGASRPACPE